MNFLEIAKVRQSCRSYNPDRPVEAEKLQAVLEAVPERGGAYVRFPYDLRQEFGRGRVRVRADFDGVSYRGSLVYMGVFREDGTPCPILGVRKDIRERLGKQPGDTVTVTLEALEE